MNVIMRASILIMRLLQVNTGDFVSPAWALSLLRRYFLPMRFAILPLLVSDVILREYLEKLESDAFSLSAACLSLQYYYFFIFLWVFVFSMPFSSPVRRKFKCPFKKKLVKLSKKINL